MAKEAWEQREDEFSGYFAALGKICEFSGKEFEADIKSAITTYAVRGVIAKVNVSVKPYYLVIHYLIEYRIPSKPAFQPSLLPPIAMLINAHHANHPSFLRCRLLRPIFGIRDCFLATFEIAWKKTDIFIAYGIYSY